MIVTKGSENFPTNKERMNGFIDVWSVRERGKGGGSDWREMKEDDSRWVVHDGGLLMLLPFLLKQHKVRRGDGRGTVLKRSFLQVWRSCSLRLFVIATIEENNVQVREMGRE